MVLPDASVGGEVHGKDDDQHEHIDQVEREYRESKVHEIDFGVDQDLDAIDPWVYRRREDKSPEGDYCKKERNPCLVGHQLVTPSATFLLHALPILMSAFSY